MTSRVSSQNTKMSRFHLKITHTTKKTRSQTEWKRQSVEANTKATEMLGLSDKDLKAVMIKMIQWKIMNMLETKEK